MDIVSRIERLFSVRGTVRPRGARATDVTALEHALQCAQLAQWAELTEPLVAAALLHDIGHLLGDDGPAPGARHEWRGAAFLADGFGPEVVEPVRLHVQAKRYLVTVDSLYIESLSPASREALPAQGDRMERDELHRFEALPHALDAVTLRRLDDVSRQPGRTTPPLRHFLAVLERVRRPAREPAHP